MPPQKDLSIWKGNSTPVLFRFKTFDGAGNEVPLDLAGSVLVFRATWLDENDEPEALKITTPGAGLQITNPSGGQAVLQFSVPQTRLLPTGQIAKYEIERQIGSEQRTLVYGTLKVSEWANDD